MSIFKSQLVPFQLENVMGQQSASIHLRENDFLETIHMSIFQKGEMYLELNKLNTEPMEKIMILKAPPQEETNFETECCRTFHCNFGPFPAQILVRLNQPLILK